MPRYKLIIAYDGTDFCGWQKQEPPAGTEVRADKVMRADGGPEEGFGGPESETHDPGSSGVPRIVLRTVQEVVERAARSVVNEPVVVMGASRTDSGVHARGQVAAFTCAGDDEPTSDEVTQDGFRPTPVPAVDSPSHRLTVSPFRVSGWPRSRGTDRLVAALNARLPEDVVVLGAGAVEPGFDPISDCVSKGYSYTLHVAPDRPLFDRRFVHHVWVPLNVEAMRRGAERIVGEHDFAAFAKAGHGRESTVRTVFKCDVVAEAAMGPAAAGERGGGGAQGADWARRVRIEVSGSGFLYNMVRIIAGTLVEVGRGRLTPDDVATAIESKDRQLAGPTLPAHGLCLEWIRYAHG